METLKDRLIVMKHREKDEKRDDSGEKKKKEKFVGVFVG